MTTQVRIELLPDELALGAIGRYRNVITTEELLALCNAGHSKPRKTTLSPPHGLSVEQFSQLCELSSQSILINHTCLPFSYAIRHDASRGQVEKRIPDGKTQSFWMAIHARQARACSACIESDHACYGSSFWHRIHQLPGVTTCHIHRRPLLQIMASPANCTPSYALRKFPIADPFRMPPLWLFDLYMEAISQLLESPWCDTPEQIAAKVLRYFVEDRGIKPNAIGHELFQATKNPRTYEWISLALSERLREYRRHEKPPVASLKAALHGKSQMTQAYLLLICLSFQKDKFNIKSILDAVPEATATALDEISEKDFD